MKIETISKSTGLNGGPEVWVHVFSNDVLDWPRIEKALTDEQRAQLEALGPRALSYYPHTAVQEEREEHGFSFEDFFVWRSTKKGKR